MPKVLKDCIYFSHICFKLIMQTCKLKIDNGYFILPLVIFEKRISFLILNLKACIVYINAYSLSVIIFAAKRRATTTCWSDMWYKKTWNSKKLIPFSQNHGPWLLDSVYVLNVMFKEHVKSRVRAVCALCRAKRTMKSQLLLMWTIGLSAGVTIQ